MLGKIYFLINKRLTAYFKIICVNKIKKMLLNNEKYFI